jgi:hypothetical protein
MEIAVNIARGDKTVCSLANIFKSLSSFALSGVLFGKTTDISTTRRCCHRRKTQTGLSEYYYLGYDLFELSQKRSDKKDDPDMGRRKFLTGLGAIVAVGTTMGSSALANTLSPKKAERASGEEELDFDEYILRKKEFLKEEYGIDLHGVPESGQTEVLGKRPPLEKYKNAIRMLLDELAAYECPEMIRNIGEGRGFEVRLLEYPYEKKHGVSTDGKEDEIQYVGGAAPHLREGKPAQMILSVNEDEDLFREDVHHELGHNLSYRFENQEKRNGFWAALNSPETYGAQIVPKGIHPRTPADKNCFLTIHAQENAEEDQAVTAGWMMRPNLLFEFLERWHNEKDPVMKTILGAKYVQTQANYRAWSGGKMNEAYWKRKVNAAVKEKNIREAK